MTEEEVREWLSARDVPRETTERLAAFAEMVRAESEQQNLIARSTIETLWERHILDSAQLAFLASEPSRPWLDIGSGAGFPGIVLACLTGAQTMLVEPRKLRVAFLESVVSRLGLSDTVSVHAGKIAVIRLPTAPANITARAFASLETIFEATRLIAAPNSCWIIPKGRSARDELESVKRTWQGVFHVEQSASDPEAAIIVARDVGRRKAR